MGRGSIVGSVSAIDDVTAQRAIEAERERVAQFQQQMLAMVGHDLRNPLSAIVTKCRDLEDVAACGLVARASSCSGSATARAGWAG